MRPGWLDLRADPVDARALLSRFPESGPYGLSWRLQTLGAQTEPFVIWCVETGASVVMLRLFHVRQSARLP